VVEIKDDADYELVKRAGIELGKVRVSIEKDGKTARDDANALSKAIIAEQKRLVAIIGPEESRLKALRKEIDDKAEREAEEARQVEVARIETIRTNIAGIQELARVLPQDNAATIQGALNTVEAVDLSAFAEYTDQAAAAAQSAIFILEAALKARKEFEAQQADQARIAKEQAEKQAELDKQAETQRQAEAQARDKLDAEQAAVRKAEQAVADEKLAVEQAKLDEERTAASLVLKDNERLQKESDQRAEDDRLAKDAEAKAAADEAMKPEKQKLTDWLKKLRFIDGVSLENQDLINIQSGVLKALDVISKSAVKEVDAL